MSALPLFLADGLSGGAARHAVAWWLTDVQSPLLRMVRLKETEAKLASRREVSADTSNSNHLRL